MKLSVFFPSLMGVGILISGALLVSDWVRRMLPAGQMRRKRNVVIGTYGSVAATVAAAGYSLEEPWFLKRGLRDRRTYLLWSLGCGAGGFAAMWAGERFHDDPLGLFFRSPWATGIGYGVGAALLLAALLSLLIAVAYRASPRLLMWLVSETPVGRVILPSTADQVAALHDVAKEQP